jgi:hypothetical protein
MTANAQRQCRGSADPGDLFLDCSSAASAIEARWRVRSALAPTLPALQNELASFLESLSVVERICRRSRKLGPVRTAGSRYWIVGGAMISLPLQAFLTQIQIQFTKNSAKEIPPYVFSRHSS